MSDVYLDTEFHDDGERIDLISIGLVCGDRELYAVNADMDQDAVRAHPWLSVHVWPQLPLSPPVPGPDRVEHAVLNTGHADVQPKAEIARRVSSFLAHEPDPVLRAWWAAYDEVVLAQLWGPLGEAPVHVPFPVRCLDQEAERVGARVLPVQRTPGHHALHDAYHARRIHAYLREVEAISRN